MCAGRCREPRRKGTRVAAPSGCIVPWAARASCWPQPQQLLPVSAAGSGRRCCTGAFLPAGLFGGSMLFESTLAVPFARQIKQKLRYPLDTGVLGGRGWIARAAHLKKPLRGFFAAGTDGGGRCCSNPPACVSLLFVQKKNARVFLHKRSLGGAKQPKSEPLPSGASLAAISSKVMVFVPSL